jgi:Niemann-Pick C1 protein
MILLDLYTAVMVSVFSYAVVMQVFGMLLPMGIKFSAIPAVSLIMSIGLAVEFTAHICTHFAAAKGSRNDRIGEAMHHMFKPVMDGGLSSFISLSTLSLSPFTFVILYYFGIYMLVVWIGMLNGLVFLPCVLGLCGPVSDSKPAGQVQVAPAPDNNDNIKH